MKNTPNRRKGEREKGRAASRLRAFVISVLPVLFLTLNSQLSTAQSYTRTPAYRASAVPLASSATVQTADVYILANANSGVATTTNDLWAATDLGSSGLGAWRFDRGGGFSLTQTNGMTNTSASGHGLASTISVTGGSSHADAASTWGWIQDLSVNPTVDAEILFTNASKPIWVSVLYYMKTDFVGTTADLIDTVTIHPTAPETWSGTIQYQDGFGTPKTNGVVVHGSPPTLASGHIFETNTAGYYHVVTFGNTNAGGQETLTVYSNDASHTSLGSQSLPITNGLTWSYLQLMGSANNHASFPNNHLFWGAFAIRIKTSGGAGTPFNSADIQKIFGTQFDQLQASAELPREPRERLATRSQPVQVLETLRAPGEPDWTP